MTEAFLAVVSMSALGLAGCGAQGGESGASSKQALPETLQLLVTRSSSAPVSPTLPPAPPIPHLPVETDLDRAIGAALGRELVQGAGLDKRNLRIAVKNGSVTVTGIVKTEKDRQKVNELAMNVAGVKSVANALQVSP